MNMKRIISGILLVSALVFSLPGCDTAKDRTTYEGPEYVMFADTLTLFPVTNNESVLDITVGSTIKTNYDRTYAVKVDDKKSTAIDGVHYNLESNSVTIKAGENSAILKIKGLFDNFNDIKPLTVQLRLLAPEASKWSLYGTETKVQLMKACPFDIDAFTGYFKVRSSYFDSYMQTTSMRLVMGEQMKDRENTILMKSLFYDGFDIALSFDPTNVLKPFVSMENQILGSTAEAFGTIYGDGKLRVTQPQNYQSYFNVCEGYIFHYMTVYVYGEGTVGTYITIFEWVSDREAEELKKLGY